MQIYIEKNMKVPGDCIIPMQRQKAQNLIKNVYTEKNIVESFKQ